MRTLLKGAGLIPLLLLYLLLSGVICLLPVHQKTKRGAAIRTTSGFARVVLFLLNVRVRVKHGERLRETGDIRLIVSNHLSYIDVLVISSLVPSVFITSVELKNTALLGTLARLSGSIFVERRRPSGLKREIEDIAFALGQGMPVVLFPEGTTSNGDRVQPFKNSLFDAAVLTRADIVPICLSLQPREQRAPHAGEPRPRLLLWRSDLFETLPPVPVAQIHRRGGRPPQGDQGTSRTIAKRAGRGNTQGHQYRVSWLSSQRVASPISPQSARNP